MRLQREVSLGIGAILGLQLLLSVLAIGLLVRMGPAIEKILQENVYSGAAIEEMISLLVTAPLGSAPSSFQAALKRAQNNVTEKAEQPLLAKIKALYVAAFRGDKKARADIITTLQALGQVNRDSMERADLRAKRMGNAGAWAFAILGAMAFALGIMLYRRLRLRLEQPIETLRDTTQRIREGNLHARIPDNQWPHEVKQIASDINWILDRWLTLASNSQPGAAMEREAEIHRALAWFIEQDDAPAMLLAQDDARIAFNPNALDIELPLHNKAKDGAHWALVEIPNTNLRLARFQQSKGTPEQQSKEAPKQLSKDAPKQLGKKHKHTKKKRGKKNKRS